MNVFKNERHVDLNEKKSLELRLAEQNQNLESV